MFKTTSLKLIRSCCTILLLLISTLASAAPLRFATYASERPSEELKKMEPFRVYLEQALHNHGASSDIKMRIFSTYEDAIDAIVNGDADFARLGPASYVTAKKRKPLLQLLVMEGKQGKKFFNGVIMVADKSDIKNLSDLKGKRFAFGEINSTTGRYLAQQKLLSAGIKGSDLAGYEYIGRHDKVAFAVAAGDFDAGAANETTLEKHSQSKSLRQIAAFSSPTHAWVARAGLDPKVVKQLQKALLNMKGTYLEYVGRDGFLLASDADYDDLRNSMRSALAFDD